jgi:hypothetical protein
MIMSDCLAALCSQLGTSLADSLAWQTYMPDAITGLWNIPSLARQWQTHLPGKLTFPTPLLYTQVQYQCRTGGSYVEKPAETLRLASAS